MNWKIEECKAIAGIAGVKFSENDRLGIILYFQHPIHGYRQLATRGYNPGQWRKVCIELLSNKPQPIW